MEIKPNKRPYYCKTMVTKENLDRILSDIKRGSPNKYAAESNRISESHFYELLKQGVCDINNGKFDTLHAYLAESLRKIEQEEIISCKADIRQSEKSHLGAQWILEHCFWRTFSGDGKLIQLASEIEQEKGAYKNEDVSNEEANEKNS